MTTHFLADPIVLIALDAWVATGADKNRTAAWAYWLCDAASDLPDETLEGVAVEKLIAWYFKEGPGSEGGSAVRQ